MLQHLFETSHKQLGLLTFKNFSFPTPKSRGIARGAGRTSRPRRRPGGSAFHTLVKTVFTVFLWGDNSDKLQKVITKFRQLEVKFSMSYVACENIDKQKSHHKNLGAQNRNLAPGTKYSAKKLEISICR